MKRTDLSLKLQKLLKEVHYVAIATVCADGQPWNTPVFCSFDDDLNMYWVSWRNNNHSQNIARDGRIFVVVYDTSAPPGKGVGMYLQMHAAPLEDEKEIAKACARYDTSFFRLASGKLPTFEGDCPSRIYKASLRKAWYNAGARTYGYFIDVRRKITA